MQCDVHAIPTIAISEDFYLPFSQIEGQEHLKVNQFCEDCTESSLCSVHKAMVPKTKESDFTHLHMTALRESGRAVVECGGEGDCFYHSALWLMHHFGVSAGNGIDHKQLRLDTVTFFEHHWSEMQIPLDDTETIPIMDLLRPNHPRQEDTDLAVVEAFAQKQKLSCRFVANDSKKVLVYNVYYTNLIHSCREHIKSGEHTLKTK